MAVTTTYDFDFVANIAPLAGNESGPDAVGLANGGFAYAVTQAGAGFAEVFGPTASSTGSEALSGASPSIAQLQISGNLVVAGRDGAAGVGFGVIDVAGNVVVPFTSLGDTNTSVPDVAGLSNGGFVLVTQDNFSPTDNDIDVHIRNASGTPVTNFTIDNSLADDRNPSVIAISGGFAVAWERHVAGSTQLWAAVYENNGTVVTGATLIDGTGSVNEDASSAALADGRLAFVFEDNEGGSRDIRLMIFPNILGAPLVNVRLTTAGSNETNPDIEVLPSGLLAVTYQEDDDGPGDIDSHVMLVDPATGAVLADQGFNFAIDNQTNPAVAAMSLGRVAVFSDVPGDNVEGEIYQAIRTSTGDGADDPITGDDLVDVVDSGNGSDTINGLGSNDTIDAGGNRDTLDGGEGDDLLQGGPDHDLVLGGAGNDALYGNRAALPDGSAFTDTLNGGLGDDFLRGAAGSATASYAGGPAVTVSLALTGPQNTIGAGVDTLVNIANLEGGDGGDTLTGNDGDNHLTGGGGNDTLDGSGDSDTLNGGINNDTLYGGDNDDTLYGGDNNDTLNGDVGNDTLAGGANNDTLNGGDDNDTLLGGLGTDTVNGGAGDDVIRVLNGENIDVVDGGDDFDTLDMSAETTTASSVDLEAGTHTGTGGTRAVTNVEDFIGTQLGDLIIGSIATNLLEGRGGNDTVQGGLNVDTVHGGGGNDTIIVLDFQLIDVVDGGDSTDTYDFSAETTYAVTIDLQGGTATGLGGTRAVINVENVIGTQAGDSITGNAATNALTGGSGNDTLFGGVENDVVQGNGDDDEVHGDAGLDTVGGGQGNDSVYGETGNDVLAGGLGNDFLQGNEDDDSENGNGGLDTVGGGAGNDTLFGGADNDSVVGGNGNDSVYGGSATSDPAVEADTLSGGVGNDFLQGSGGNDQVQGDAGQDTVGGGGDNDTLFGGADNDVLAGGNGNDSVYGGSTTSDAAVEADTLSGGEGTDFVQGNGGDDQVHGDAGSDSVGGGGGNDTVFGDADGDQVNGGAGNDTLTGGTGGDTLNGGTDNDRFVFLDGHGADTVSDFAFNGVEKFDLSGLVTGAQNFGQLVFTDTPGPGITVSYGTGSFLVANINTTGALSATDFLF